jgi:hypothetical protein
MQLHEKSCTDLYQVVEVTPRCRLCTSISATHGSDTSTFSASLRMDSPRNDSGAIEGAKNFKGPSAEARGDTVRETWVGESRYPASRHS